MPRPTTKTLITYSDNRAFFFFQAEDSIRDYKVTGVQTCALPISAVERSGPGLTPVSGCGGPVARRWRPQRVASCRHRHAHRAVHDATAGDRRIRERFVGASDHARQSSLAPTARDRSLQFRRWRTPARTPLRTPGYGSEFCETRFVARHRTPAAGLPRLVTASA